MRVSVHGARVNLARLALTAFLAGLLMSVTGLAEEVALEEKTKAVFIYNFTKYIEWPNPDSSSTFTVGVIGNSGVLPALHQIGKIKRVGARTITTSHFADTTGIDSCEILFISASERRRLSQILKKTKDKPILTVGDSKGLAKQGVGINFVTVDGKIKFEINRNALEAAGLRASSQLLKLAIIVGEEGGMR